MSEKVILAVDQSTQGTKGLIFDGAGRLACRADRPHRQIVNDLGWVEHDPEEILQNTLGVCADVLKKSGIDPGDVAAFAISNQRETSLMWDRATGRPVYNAVVWQCARAERICERPEIQAQAETIRRRTGIPLSPYFPAAKLCWIMENVPEAGLLAKEGRLAAGTVDSWLLFNLTGRHLTDYSNASRTQLFNIVDLRWDPELCRLFSVPLESLPEVIMSDGDFGNTDLNGLLPEKVPVRGVLGDSHGALFGQNCREPGRVKATYGTGSSVMMNIGIEPRFSKNGLVTSLAWGIDNRVEYVFEGNLNYTGAVMTWLRRDVGLISTDMEATELALKANPRDKTYFVPAFTGLGAPYWDSRATGLLTGVTRTTGRAEIARACLDCIAYQITDLVRIMGQDAGMEISQLRADGGPTASGYLMQLQSDMTRAVVRVPQLQELSGMGAAYAAGMAVGLYDRDRVYDGIKYRDFTPDMPPERREELYGGWLRAVRQTIKPFEEDQV